jgi:xylulose-5-phosphate/fructose-6-phosphate phosphoketolase
MAAVSILKEHLPDLKIRVVNVVDLMKLESATEHPHGLTDAEFDALFTKDKPIVFAFHGYPKLIHFLPIAAQTMPTCMFVGYKEEGTITTFFDNLVLNDLDRFHLVMDVINRVPQLIAKGAKLKRLMEEKLIEHRAYINKNGQDMPEIRDWKWNK